MAYIMTTDEQKVSLDREVQRLINEECWAIAAGEGTGGDFTCDFGGKIPWCRKIDNPNLSLESRRFKGTYSLYVTCAWRVDSAHEVICGYQDPNSNDGIMVTGLNRLLNQKVTGIALQFPAADLSIFFEGGLVLRIFCSETHASGRLENYCFFTPERTWGIGYKGEIEIDVEK